VLTVRHPHHVFEGLVIDGQLGAGRTVRLRDQAAQIVLRDLEIHHSGNNCVDLGYAQEVLIEQCSIHHCLLWDGGPADAHGITGDGPQKVTVRDSEIFLFSGDAIQISPPRDFWDELLVERTTMWIGPLPEAAGSFSQGVVYGENAFDSKTPDAGPRPRATFRDVVAHGFKGFITNQGAFNVKENVDFTLDRATVYDSELAFRMRGPAKAVVRNAVAYGNDAVVRYEDAIEGLTFQNVTFADPLVDGGGGAPVAMVFANALFVGAGVPPEAASGQSCLAADAGSFVAAAEHDYHLLPGAPAVDSGITLPEVEVDRDGVPRPVGPSYDVGAYEWTDAPPGPGGAGGGGAAAGGGVPGGGGAGGAAGGSIPFESDNPQAGGCGCRLPGPSPRPGDRWLVLGALGLLLCRGRSQIRPGSLSKLASQRRVSSEKMQML
jgi:hypothetical protein